MKSSLNNLQSFLVLFLLVFIFKGRSQTPSCPNPYVYLDGPNYLRFYDPALPLSNTNPNSTNIPSNGIGLTLCPNINGGSPSPTFYSVGANKNYYYWNGSVWIDTGHFTGHNGAVNPGGCAGKIYNYVGATGEIYVYNGSSPGTLLTTITSFSGAIYDVVTDCSCNFYIMNGSVSPQTLKTYNSSGVQTASYSLVNYPISSAGSGLAIIGNQVYVTNGLANGFYVGTISGSSVTFTNVIGALMNNGDYASCPVCPGINGIENISNQDSELLLFPNPSIGEFELNLSEVTETLIIRIYNMLGQLVYQSIEAPQNTGISKKINLSQMPEGSYIIKTTSGEYFNNKKLLIVK